MAKEPNRSQQKRIELRNRLWPNSEQAVWNPGDLSLKGYARVTRLLPLIMMLIGKVGGKGGNPASAYLELWFHDWGDGIVSITDEEQHAYRSGYATKRAVRTWREHMRKLVSMGFIRAEKEYNREFAHVLLLNPLAVCARVCQEQKGDPEWYAEWWNAFNSTAEKYQAAIPKPAILRLVKGGTATIRR